MANLTLSIPEELYRRMRNRRDVRWSEVARRAIAEKLEDLEGPEGFETSASALKEKIAKAGIDIEKISVEDTVAHYRKMRNLEWKRVSTTRAN